MSEPKQYRKKPIVIEAVQYACNEYGDSPAHVREWLPEWWIQAVESGTITFEFHGEDYWYAVIHTLEGPMTASPDDWIIRGVNGELYPCKPDIFAKTYEPT